MIILLVRRSRQTGDAVLAGMVCRKAQMVRLQPRSIKLRHLVAPVFVFSLIVLVLLSAVFWTPARWLLLVELAVYLFAALAAGWHTTRRTDRSGLGLVLLMPLVFATIHLSWGTSFLLGIIGPQKAQRIKPIGS